MRARLRYSRPARYGFLVITTLMVTVLLLVLGIGFMGSRAGRYRATSQSILAAEARQLSMSGLEDARFKLQNDDQFPPPFCDPTQTCFTYNEQMTYGAGTSAQQPCSYQVLLETMYYNYPPATAGLGPTVAYHIYQITSIGTIGDPSAPLAQYKIMGEMDMDPTPPRKYCRYTHFVDYSAP